MCSASFLHRQRFVCVPRTEVSLVLLAVTLTVLPLQSNRALAQEDVWVGKNGMWSQDANWTFNRPPQPTDDCAIPSSSSPTDDTAGTCKSFSMTAGDTLTVTPGYLFISGPSIHNNGSIRIGDGNGLGIGNNVVLSGTGSVTMTTPGARIGAFDLNLTLFNQETIQGQGSLGLGTMGITNQGTILSSGGTLSVQPNSAGFINAGMMQAQPGSTMDLIGQVIFNNTGGEIEALGNSTILLDTNISGGTLNTVGTGQFTLKPPGGGSFIDLTTTGTVNVPAGAVLNWQGTINNTGTLHLNGTILTNGTVTLQGAGSVIVKGGIFSGGGGTNPLINKQLIHGGGTFQQVPLTNQATIQADIHATPLSIVGSSMTNSSILQATTGGTLQIETTVNNSVGTIEAQNASTVVLGGNFNGTVSGGTLTTVGSGTIQSQNGTLDGTVSIPTNAGRLNVNNFDLFIQGTINNMGTIALTGNSCVILNQPSTLNGSGKLIMASTSCIFGSGLAFTNQSTILGAGTIGDSNPMPITNNGIIFANSTSPLTIQPDATGFTNNGRLIVNAGSTLKVNGLFKNFSPAGTLTGGTYLVNGTLGLQNSIVTNAASITLTGTTAQIVNNSTATNALQTLVSNAAKGVLSLQGGEALTTITSVSNAGTMTIGTGSQLSLGGSYTQTGGATTVDGILTAPTGLTLQKGSMVGKGTITAAVTSTASITAGDSSTNPAKLSITGSFAQSSTGTLNISVGGTAAGKFGELSVSNGAALGGTLSIKLVNGFVPAVGNSFTILTGTAVTGKFATVKGTSINASEHFQVNYNATSVTLTVVSGA
jgi:hypothetical protein